MLLINNNIFEYDMKEAGFSVIQEFSLLSEKEIDYLKKMPKYDRTVMIGKMSRSKKDLFKNINQRIKESVEIFMQTNNLSNFVLSIKKDAVFAAGSASVFEFGKYLKFVIKNKYSSCMLTKKFELYYNSSKMDVKGFSLKEHPIFDKFKQIFKSLELGNNPFNELKEFRNNFLSLTLPKSYYVDISENVFLFKMSEDYFLGISNENDIVYEDIFIEGNFWIIIEFIKEIVSK